MAEPTFEETAVLARVGCRLAAQITTEVQGPHGEPAEVARKDYGPRPKDVGQPLGLSRQQRSNGCQQARLTHDDRRRNLTPASNPSAASLRSAAPCLEAKKLTL